jgi:hypothetical protein
MDWIDIYVEALVTGADLTLRLESTTVLISAGIGLK